MSDWHYGRIGSATAVLADGRLLVRVDGTRPAPDVQVMLSAYPYDVGSSTDVEMGLYWRTATEPPPDAPAPFTVRAEVDIRGVRAPTLRIYHASGYVDVRVRHAGPGG